MTRNQFAMRQEDRKDTDGDPFTSGNLPTSPAGLTLSKHEGCIIIQNDQSGYMLLPSPYQVTSSQDAEWS
jgi:hypothetical protein